MEKVVNKFFIEDKEVILIAERCGTKFYADSEDKTVIYVTNYDEVIAVIDPNTDWIIDIKNEYKVNNEAN